MGASMAIKNPAIIYGIICGLLICERVYGTQTCSKGIYYADHSVCFWLVLTQQNFTDSQKICSSDNGILALIPDPITLTFLNTLRDSNGKKFDEFYIGYSVDINTNELIRLDNNNIQAWAPWRTGQPSGSGTCVSSFNVAGTFWSELCSDIYYAICQLQSKTTESTTVEATTADTTSGPTTVETTTVDTTSGPTTVETTTVDTTSGPTTVETTTVDTTSDPTTVETTTVDTTSDPTTVETTTVDTTSGPTTVETTTVDTTSVTLSSSAATAVGGTTNPTCSCACQPTVVKANLTSQEIAEKAENISRILSVDKKTLSSTIRSKTSAVDNRPSATGVGCVGVVLLALTIGGIFMMDVPVFLNFAKSIYNTFQILKQ